MRYLNKSISKISIVFKSIILLTITAVLTFLIMKNYGVLIAESACDFLFRNTQSNRELKFSNQNYENDFLKFLSFSKTEQEKEPEIQTPVSNSNAIAVNLSALSGKYKNYDGTAVINSTDYKISDLLYAGYEKPIIDKSLPAVLIYHTHTSEGYYGGGSVVDVGRTMVEEFEKAGYKTIHLTEYYDKEQFSGAYSRSIKGIEKILAENPSIKLVFDIHRDAITTANGDTYQPLTTVENNSCAQVMFVCGTDAKGLKHPNWKENFKFALDVSRKMGSLYGALSRPVNLRGDRFNTHTTKYSFIMEIGSEANTLDEAKLAGVYTVRSVIETIK